MTPWAQRQATIGNTTTTKQKENSAEDNQSLAKQEIGRSNGEASRRHCAPTRTAVESISGRLLKCTFATLQAAFARSWELGSRIRCSDKDTVPPMAGKSMWLVLHKFRDMLAESCGTGWASFAPPACLSACNASSCTKASFAHPRAVFAGSWQLGQDTLLIVCCAGASSKSRVMTLTEPDAWNMCARCCELKSASFGMAAAAIACIARIPGISGMVKLRAVLAKFCGGKLGKCTAPWALDAAKEGSCKSTSFAKAQAVLPAS